MSKLMTILAASGLALLGATSLAGASGTSSSKQKPKKAVAVIPMLGPAAEVPAGQFVKAFVYCPKGYYVTGGGAYNGAVTEVARGPPSLDWLYPYRSTRASMAPCPGPRNPASPAASSSSTPAWSSTASARR